MKNFHQKIIVLVSKNKIRLAETKFFNFQKKLSSITKKNKKYFTIKSNLPIYKKINFGWIRFLSDDFDIFHNKTLISADRVWSIFNKSSNFCDVEDSFSYSKNRSAGKRVFKIKGLSAVKNWSQQSKFVHKFI